MTENLSSLALKGNNEDNNNLTFPKSNASPRKTNKMPSLLIQGQDFNRIMAAEKELGECLKMHGINVGIPSLESMIGQVHNLCEKLAQPISSELSTANVTRNYIPSSDLIKMPSSIEDEYIINIIYIGRKSMLCLTKRKLFSINRGKV